MTDTPEGNHRAPSRLWASPGGTLVAELTAEASVDVSAVAFDPSGRYVVCAAEDRTAQIWAVDDEPRQVGAPPHPGQVLCLGFSPDGRLLATGCSDGVADCGASAPARRRSCSIPIGAHRLVQPGRALPSHGMRRPERTDLGSC